jgi:hypothetical protein
MTISLRNRLLAGCLAVETAMAAAYGIGAFLCIRAAAFAPAMALLKPEFPLFIIKRTAASSAISSFASAGALVLASLAAGALTLRWFKKTASSEILFIGIALAAFSMEGLRAFLLLSRAVPTFVLVPALLTRAVISARWAGVFFLLGGSLYATGLDYGKSGQFALIAGFISLVIGATVPLRSNAMNSSFLVGSGYAADTSGASMALILMCVLGYAIAAFRKGSKDHAWMGFGIALAGLGRFGLLHASDPVICAASFASLSGGAFIYLRKQYKRALWG